MKTVIIKTHLVLATALIALSTTVFSQTSIDMLALTTVKVGTAFEANLTATVNKNGSDISWKAIKQINVRRYELEKSSDGINFSYFTALPASHKQTQFAIQDKYLYEGANYYRLKIVDQKGNFCYSQAASFDRSSIVNEIKVLTGIATQEVYIWLPINTQVTTASITDLMGREMMKNAPVINLTNMASIPVSSLNSGVYQLNIVTNNGNKTTLKFSKK